MESLPQKIPASFRDPAGFIFERDGEIFRQINRSFAREFEQFNSSGLYGSLLTKGLIVAHEEIPLPKSAGEDAYKIIKPERIPVLNFPYEWSFSQLKGAALMTLDIQKLALEHGMILKDASAFNIQFAGCEAKFIDTLSFAPYVEGAPWPAYRQFCQHFLAPLLLMSKVDIHLSQLSKLYIDGIPLNLASKLLPRRTWISIGALMHIHVHAKAQGKYSSETKSVRTTAKVSKIGLRGLIDNLTSYVHKLDWHPQGTEWSAYYSDTNYTDEGLNSKQAMVEKLIRKVTSPLNTTLDLGANAGPFSRIAARQSKYVVSVDLDPAAVEKNYLLCKKEKLSNVLPLVLDLTNPSPSLGWENTERPKFFKRVNADLVLALALIHHLVFANNVPLDRVVQFFKHMGAWLIIEFVPKDDSQVRRLLANREDIATDYHRQGFEAAFEQEYFVQESMAIPESGRRLYLMQRKPTPSYN